MEQVPAAMSSAGQRLRFLIHLQWFLFGHLVDSSSLSSAGRFLSVTSRVGNQVVLPCSWKPRLGEAAAAAPACHVQWTKPADTVFEQWGARTWQAADFDGRVRVPEEKLGSGDCSLVISDAQIKDTGTYESFMVVDGARAQRTRVFIQSVKLSVFDHKSRMVLAPGRDLVLDLHTRFSLRVVFLPRNSSEWLDLWMREDKDSGRLEKHPLKEQLTVRNLSRSDEGTYKVLDEQGLAVSTVLLSVEDESTALKVHQVMENEITAGAAATSSCSALLVLSALVTTFQIPRLL